MKRNRSIQRVLAALLPAGLTLMLLAACGHTHSPSGGWAADLKNHWYSCECGEQVNLGAHTMDDSVCTVCGCELFTPDDESIHLAISNEDGNYTQYSSFALDGSVNYTYEYEYGDGTMTETEYQADVLTARREYLLDATGMQMLVKDIAYNEDGTFTACGYDKYGNETLEGRYAADGQPESETTYENEYDADGNRTLRRTYTDGMLTQEMEFLFGSDAEGSWSQSGKTTTYHEDGTKTVSDSALDGTWATEITYDANGAVLEEIRYVYEYDDQGNSVGAKGYLNGRLFQESRGTTGPDGTPGMLIIDYAEDGSKTVREYGEYLDMVKETTYDAAGNVITG